MNPLVLTVIKWLIPVLAPVLVEAVKAAMAGMGQKIPDWLKPLISALFGAILGGVTGDPASLQVTAPLGASLGLAGSKLRDIAAGKAGTRVPDDMG